RPLKCELFTDTGTCAFFWKAGSAKTSLMPPPVAPPEAPPFHATSPDNVPCALATCVPPHASTCGLELGKSTCACPSVTPSLEPVSPDAQHTVTPSAAASWNASSYEVSACVVHVDSGPPQLIDTIVGRRVVSWMAVVIASRKP